ncbi:hypothetical protein [Roseovarius sp. ZX-A-9]|uniref:hypothetical protein n=1 Tax=Roseovarius sp. ZX-A-9 TaxID=3014783 RepID=UPI00232F299A|nr:hypothetical protein [Roseovarius sp. ZX-A-9]
MNGQSGVRLALGGASGTVKVRISHRTHVHSEMNNCMYSDGLCLPENAIDTCPANIPPFGNSCDSHALKCIANTSIAVAFAVGLRPFYSPFTLAEEDPNTDQCEMKKCHNLANKLKH